MTQREKIIEAMEQCGGRATLPQIYTLADLSSPLWQGSQDPRATLRCTLQRNKKDFYNIIPGEWGLVAKKKENESAGATATNQEHSHAFYQGMLVEVGNAKGLATFIPANDKNKEYNGKTLGEIATLKQLHDFCQNHILRNARTVDTIWFNERQMPHAFFEVEHTTNIDRSLDKFLELQDFNAFFYIVADNKKKHHFDELLSDANSRYKPLRLVKFANKEQSCKRVMFYSYEQLSKWHEHFLAALEVSIA